MDFVGESGPIVFFCMGEDLAEVGVFLGVGGDLGTEGRSGVCFCADAAFGEGGGMVFFGVGTDFGVAGGSACFGVIACGGDNGNSGFVGGDTIMLATTPPVFVVVFKEFFSPDPFNWVSVAFASFADSVTLAAVGEGFSVFLTAGTSSAFFTGFKTDGFSVFFSAFIAAGPTLIGNSPFCDIELCVGPTGMKFDLTRVIGVIPFPAVDVEPSPLLPDGIEELALLFCCSKKARKEDTYPRSAHC